MTINWIEGEVIQWQQRRSVGGGKIDSGGQMRQWNNPEQNEYANDEKRQQSKYGKRTRERRENTQP